MGALWVSKEAEKLKEVELVKIGKKVNKKLLKTMVLGQFFNVYSILTEK